jgi:hypothetical protein
MPGRKRGLPGIARVLRWRRLLQLVVDRVPARSRRAGGLLVLCTYSLILGLASLELVPFPQSLSGVSGLAGDAASLGRRAAIIPGPALFYDRDETPIGVLTNCVEIVGVTEDGDEEPIYSTPMCGTEPEPALLGDPVDKVLVRLHFDGLVYRFVPADGGPTSGDRILAAIGYHYCGHATEVEPAELRIVWWQAVEDRRDGTRAWVLRSENRWSCTSSRLIDREWYPYFTYPETDA